MNIYKYNYIILNNKNKNNNKKIITNFFMQKIDIKLK